MTVAPVQPGDILAGKYRVERVLGVGGMGVVVAATHLDLFELRAIKFMIPSALSNAEAVERFLREARAAARLKSEHVAKVHDVGRLENGSPYMVMEYLEGSDLHALVKRQGTLSPALAALYTIQACQALAEAHALGIVHRDLKPANLFLTTRPDGSACVKVLDFGISKVLGGGTPGADFEVTKTHEVLGSPSYMSPEQLRSAKGVDARTDIWSMGVILYRLITGVMPFRGENITELITTILSTTPHPLSAMRPGVPRELDAVILGGCLRQDREQRYPNVAALSAALAPFAAAGAGTAVESANRLVGAPANAARALMPSHAGGPSMAVGAAPYASATPAATQAAEGTGSAWGGTAALRGSKGRLAVVLFSVGSALVFVAAVTFALTHRTTTAAAPAPVGTEAAAATASPASTPSPEVPPPVVTLTTTAQPPTDPGPPGATAAATANTVAPAATALTSVAPTATAVPSVAPSTSVAVAPPGSPAQAAPAGKTPAAGKTGSALPTKPPKRRDVFDD